MGKGNIGNSLEMQIANKHRKEYSNTLIAILNMNYFSSTTQIKTDKNPTHR